MLYYESNISASSELVCEMCASQSPLSSLKISNANSSLKISNANGILSGRAADKHNSIIPSKHEMQIGSTVYIILKCDQPTGKLTKGIIKRFLTNGVSHPRGIKVELTTGEVGRVQMLA